MWGPDVSERQWGTVREDYSEDGDAWNYLPHDYPQAAFPYDQLRLENSRLTGAARSTRSWTPVGDLIDPVE